MLCQWTSFPSLWCIKKPSRLLRFLLRLQKIHRYTHRSIFMYCTCFLSSLVRGFSIVTGTDRSCFVFLGSRFYWDTSFCMMSVVLFPFDSRVRAPCGLDASFFYIWQKLPLFWRFLMVVEVFLCKRWLLRRRNFSLWTSTFLSRLVSLRGSEFWQVFPFH